MNFRCVVPSKLDGVFGVFAESYIRHCGGAKLTVIDDGLSDCIKNKYSSFDYVASPKPFDITQVEKMAFEITDPCDLIFMNDDIIFYTENIFQKLHEIARFSSKIGMIVPVCKGGICNPLQLERNKPQNAYFVVTNKETGWQCAYLPRHMIDTVGPPDTKYKSWGVDDLDYCIRLKDSGYWIAIAYNCLIEHGGLSFSHINSEEPFIRENTVTRKALNEDYTNEYNIERFEKKWT